MFWTSLLISWEIFGRFLNLPKLFPHVYHNNNNACLNCCVKETNITQRVFGAVPGVHLLLLLLVYMKSPRYCTLRRSEDQRHFWNLWKRLYFKLSGKITLTFWRDSEILVRALTEKPREKGTTDTDGKGRSKQEGVWNCTRGCREIPDKRLPTGLGVQKGISGGKG